MQRGQTATGVNARNTPSHAIKRSLAASNCFFDPDIHGCDESVLMYARRLKSDDRNFLSFWEVKNTFLRYGGIICPVASL